MPRGRSATYDQQRDEILARAAVLFADRGYPGTSMNEVAASCGVTKPALYHYFRDKDALLAAIAQQHVDHLEDVVAEVRALKLPPAAHLRELILRFVQDYADSQHEHRVLTQDVKFLPEEDRRAVLDGERRVVAAFADATAAVRPELEAAGLHKPLTMLLFGMMNWMFTWLKPGGTLNHEAMSAVVADLFFGGLAAVQALPAKSTRRRAAPVRRDSAQDDTTITTHPQGDTP